MKITVIRKMEYADTLIYVMQFEYIFLYLFSWENEIFMNRVTMKPRILKRMLWRLGLIKTPYSQDELEGCEKVMLSGAVDSIDILKTPGFPVAMPNMEHPKPLPIET